MTQEPLLLGFDCAGAYCSVALLRGAQVLALRHEAMAKGQVERLMPLVEAVLAEADTGPDALDAIGVGIGPGNFTGIRIAVSAARGLALARAIPAVGVSGLEALADGVEGGDTPLLAVIDARRDHLYLQRFGGADPRGPALAALADVAGWARPGLRVIGDRAAEVAALTGARALPAPADPPGLATARIAARRFRAPDLPRPAPLYLRAADAAPARDTGPVILSP